MVKKIFSFLIILFFGLCLQRANFVLAQTAETNQSQAQLEQQLAELENEISSLQKQLSVTTAQKNTLANKIKQLKIKQTQLTALIKQTSLKINDLDSKINKAEQDINSNLIKEAKLKDELVDMIKLANQQDSQLIVALTSNRGLSQFFVEVQDYLNISIGLGDVVKQIRRIRLETTNKKAALEDQKDDANNLLQLKTAQKQELVDTIGEQNDLLQKTKGLEANYASDLNDKKKLAAQIRNRIYELFNTGKQINFGQAVEMAKLANKLTGINTAFVLAILTQESNLGKNVGTCNRPNDPPEKSWKVIMKPTRDQDPFLQITSELGLDPDITPVSCPMKNKKGQQVGWGGAMGPAQFIPSTWMGYKDKVAVLTGKSPANPWDIRDAFVASGLKLRSAGASDTQASWWKAAMIYFSGSTNPRYRFYGDNVVSLAKKYQQDIEDLSN
jgi:peptidoglycan hydrolase CwlO-like protein